MSKKQKSLAVLASVFLMLFTIAPVSNAMHIMEGFLPVKYCILWGVICVPFLVIGFMNIKKVLEKNSYSTCFNRCFRVRTFIFKDSISNRKLFPYDRYRSWSNLIWTMCNKYFRYHRINLPGNLTCTWWINNIRS